MGPAIWLALARDELRAAELLAEHGIAPLSCLHADQAIEKALWALHVHRVGPAGRATRGRRQERSDPPASRAPGGASQPVTETAPPPRRPLANVSRPGAERRGIASALASLTLQSGHRQPVSEDSEAERAREAVQAAHQLVDRITQRLYGDDVMM